MDNERALFTKPKEESAETTSSKPSSKRKRCHLGKAAVKDKQPEREAAPESPKTEKSEESWLAKFAEKPKEDEPKKAVGHPETVSEAEAPADGTLSPEEKETVISLKAKEAATELENHVIADDPEAAYADMKLAQYYEELQTNPDIDAVADKVIAEEGISLPADGSEALPPETNQNTEEGASGIQEEEIVYARTGESVDITAEDDEEPAGTTTASTSRPGPSGAASGGAGSHGGGIVPPAAMGNGGPGAPSGPAGFGGGPALPNFNYAPPTPNVPAAPAANEHINNRGNPAVFFVAGGIIGYLVGRRRGRIKTEKKLLPIQKKLEKQVDDLHWQIKAKESQIRKVAAEKVRQEGPAVVEVLAAKRAAAKTEKQKEAPLPTKAERAVGARQKAPEANLLHGAKAPEHIGQMLMSAEIPAAVIIPKTEQAMPKPGKIELKQTAGKAEPVLSEKTIETLNRAELLQLSEQISVEGSSLRQIYETNLVGEKGLRRLIIEHLRGGDMGRALKREITEREIDFERDPVMRDIAPTESKSSSNSGGSGGQAALNQMLEKAAAGLPASEEAAFYKAKAAYEVDQSNKHKQRRQVIDVSFAGIILTLLGAVVYLFITRG